MPQAGRTSRSEVSLSHGHGDATGNAVASLHESWEATTYPERVFGRSKNSEESTVAESLTDEATPTAAQAGKGHATPTRREAEAARKQSLKIPSDPKAARKAMRAREREERAAQRAALARGDERALPPRDQGPVRAFVRDWVDSRRLFGEFFLPLALVVLLLSLVPRANVQQLVAFGWFAMLIVLTVDVIFLIWRIRRALAAAFPDPAERKGAVFYGVMRSLQIRKLRLPPPKVKAGGAPVTPKVKRSK